MAQKRAKKSAVTLPKSLATKSKSITPAYAGEKGQDVLKDDSLGSVSGLTVKTLRAIGKVTEALRKLARVDGTVSAAVHSYVQVANSGFSVKAYNSVDHQFSMEGTNLARTVLASMDTLYDYTAGYSDKRTLNELMETSLKEVVLTGMLAGELVLNEYRLPDRINIVPGETLTYKKNGKGGKYPVQKSTTGEDIPLNIPNFWVAESQKGADRAYADSMMEAGLDMAFYYAEFIEDMRRVLRVGGHSRLVVKLDAEKVRAAAPQDAQDDDKKMQAFLAKTLSDVESVVQSLEPEDALVTYDSVEVDAIKSDKDKTDYKELMTALSGLLATSLKSHPSILGLRLAGSQSLSNTESLIFLKMARAVQVPVEAVFSRALTLAVRLYGTDVYVKFAFNNIDLRPKSELEAFKTMRQSRILELLSLGFITDEEAAEILDTGVRSPLAPALSGTMFYSKGNQKEPSPNADPQGRALQPDTPSKAGGESQ